MIASNIVLVSFLIVMACAEEQYYHAFGTYKPGR